MIDTDALDRAVRRCRILLYMARVHGIERAPVQTMMPVIVERYREEVGKS